MKRFLLFVAITLITLVFWGAVHTGAIHGYRESRLIRIHFGPINQFLTPDSHGNLYVSWTGPEWRQYAKEYYRVANLEEAKRVQSWAPSPSELVHGHMYWECGIGSGLHSTRFAAELHRWWRELHYSPEMGFPNTQTVIGLCAVDYFPNRLYWKPRPDGRCYEADKPSASPRLAEEQANLIQAAEEKYWGAKQNSAPR
jgi:hypothetical protein